VVVATAPDGTVAAHCAMVEREVAVDGGQMVTVAGVQGFSVRPPWRKAGLSDRIMALALTEARRRGIQAGLLFCLPGLERVYGRMGWRAVQFPVTMLDESGNPAPLPEKNIAMAIPLTIGSYPRGGIDLRGTDW
jgi:predicted N-acetyltransferase YhbS